MHNNLSNSNLPIYSITKFGKKTIYLDLGILFASRWRSTKLGVICTHFSIGFSGFLHHGFSEEVEHHSLLMCVCVECGDDDNDAMLTRTRRRVDRCRSSSSERRLSSLRDVQAFLSFLVGTSGETFWHLWLDIERARVIRDDHELTRCVLACQHHTTMKLITDRSCIPLH